MSTTDTNHKVIDGMTFHADTPEEVCRILSRYNVGREVRLRVHYGDAETGQDWGDIYDVSGYIGRSTGSSKIPLMISNTRSMGGGAILDHCIVRIRFANRKDGGDLYTHPNYTRPDVKAWRSGMGDETDYNRHFA